MGSLGDFSIAPENGHAIQSDRRQISEASRVLWKLTAELFQDSVRLLNTIGN